MIQYYIVQQYHIIQDHIIWYNITLYKSLQKWYNITLYHILFYKTTSYVTISHKINYYIIWFNTIGIGIMKIYTIYQQSHLSNSLSEVWQYQVLYLGLALCFKTKAKCTMKVSQKKLFQTIKRVFYYLKNLHLLQHQNNKDQTLYLKQSLFTHPSVY